MADDLPEELRALGRLVPADPRPGLAGRVLASVADRPRRRFALRPALAVLAALLALAGIALAAPPVRAAIRHVFGGVEIQRGPAPSPVPSPELPGVQVTDLAGAARIVGFPVIVPASLGVPDRVTVADGRVVTLTFGPVRLDEFARDLGVMWEKYAAMAATRTTVNGDPALWFAGPVVLEYVDAHGVSHPESARETSDTLVWIHGRTTLRLDGFHTEAAAVAAASG
jgi:hypothetical protein